MKIQTLKTIFLADAVTCAAVFLATTLAAGPLAELTGLGAGTMSVGGFICLATALLLVWLATRAIPPVALCWAVVIGNLGWVAASFATIAMTPTITALGTAIVSIQAAGVLGFAILEAIGTRALQQPRTA